MTIFHMKQSIAGCLRNNRIGTIDFLEDSKGNPLSDAEARIELNKLLDMGHTVMPVGTDCEGFDVFGGGCPGHKPLAGSDLTRAMLKRGDVCAPCFVSNESDSAAIEERLIEAVVGCGICFETAQNNWDYAVAINPKTGELFTAHEVGF